MKIDIELGKVKVRIPENKADLPVNVIVGGGGSGPEPGPSGIKLRRLYPDGVLKLNVSYTSYINE